MKFRNIAIIAHVDHGKTTLVDELLKQSGTFRANQAVAERAMDSNDLEQERGITILAKCTSVEWENTRINIVDTPGHADFGGEVERVLSMVDGVILLVDAAEGPMPQTKFVTSKALKLGLKPIVVINKVDKPDARIDYVHDEVFDLFDGLGATDEQLDFITLYASGRDGWASDDQEVKTDNLSVLFKKVVAHVPEPDVDENAPFAFLATGIESDPYLGRILTGKVHQGSLKTNSDIVVRSLDGSVVEKSRVTKILAFRGLKRDAIDVAQAGDIVAIAGTLKGTVTHTLSASDADIVLPATPIDPPTLSMTFSVNDSPLAGREGSKLTSRVIWDRLMKEVESNVALKVAHTDDQEAFEVSGRGELHLGILIENMRREGFELSISRPRVVYKTDEQGQKLEPFEEVTVDVDDAYTGVVVEKLTLRKGSMVAMNPSQGGKTRLVLHVPARGLIGYHNEFLTDTRGTGLMNKSFLDYRPYAGDIGGRIPGVLISTEQGDAVAYGLFNLEDRGIMFVEGGTAVYEGMIIGEHTRNNDLCVNPLKSKQLTNVRASGKDDAVKLTPPQKFTLEQALAYIEDDELVEVTPKSVRLRKRYLDPNERKRRSRQKDS